MITPEQDLAAWEDIQYLAWRVRLRMIMKGEKGFGY